MKPDLDIVKRVVAVYPIQPYRLQQCAEYGIKQKLAFMEATLQYQ